MTKFRLPDNHFRCGCLGCGDMCSVDKGVEGTTSCTILEVERENILKRLGREMSRWMFQ